MSTLVAQTISNGTVSTSSANVIQGSAKAWVNFNGTGGTIRASYNVSSITVNGTGDYTVNFTNAFADANYAFTCGTTQTGGGGPVIVVVSSVAPTTTQLRLGMGDVGGLRNVAYNCVSVFR
jgi:hypothetical protein